MCSKFYGSERVKRTKMSIKILINLLVSHLVKYLSTRLNVESGSYHTPSPSSASSMSNGNPGTSTTTSNNIDNLTEFQIFFR